MQEMLMNDLWEKVREWAKRNNHEWNSYIVDGTPL